VKPFVSLPSYLILFTIKMVIIQLINAIAQNEEKLKSPIKINIFHFLASENSPKHGDRDNYTNQNR